MRPIATAPVPPPKPWATPSLVLTRPQWFAEQRLLRVFATCTLDLFALASPAQAIAQITRRAQQRAAAAVAASQGAAPSDDAEPEPVFRWFLLRGSVTASEWSFRKAHAKDAEHGRGLKEVPLDAMLALGIARVNVVSHIQPVTLALEIALAGDDASPRHRAAATKYDGFIAESAQPWHRPDETSQGNGPENSSAAAAAPSRYDALQPGLQYTVGLRVRDSDGTELTEASTFVIPTQRLLPTRGH